MRIAQPGARLGILYTVRLHKIPKAGDLLIVVNDEDATAG